MTYQLEYTGIVNKSDFLPEIKKLQGKLATTMGDMESELIKVITPLLDNARNIIKSDELLYDTIDKNGGIIDKVITADYDKYAHWYYQFLGKHPSEPEYEVTEATKASTVERQRKFLMPTIDEIASNPIIKIIKYSKMSYYSRGTVIEWCILQKLPSGFIKKTDDWLNAVKLKESLDQLICEFETVDFTSMTIERSVAILITNVNAIVKD